MHKGLIWGASLAAATMVAAAVVGPDWIEPGEEDAGSLTGDAQVPDGEGALITIKGSLDGAPKPAGGGDLEDMYLISIADPVAFFATTAVLPGQTEFGSVLYLFDADGRGLLANEDAGAPGGPAGKVFGACCLEDGTCIEATKVDCQEAGGQYQGDFTSCKEVDCEVGVTCLGDVNGDGVVDVLDGARPRAGDPELGRMRRRLDDRQRVHRRDRRGHRHARRLLRGDLAAEPTAGERLGFHLRHRGSRRGVRARRTWRR
jgi:hypothetical protein